MKTFLPDHGPPAIQTARRVNTLKYYRIYFWKWKRWLEKFEEVNPLVAEAKYVANYLVDLINQSETFLAIKAYCKFWSYNNWSSFFCLCTKALKVLFSILKTSNYHCPCMRLSMAKIEILVHWQFDNIYGSIRSFLKIYWGFCAKKIRHQYWRYLYYIGLILE